MLIKELKKKNYFRYFQLLKFKLLGKENLIKIFLFENELIKIYNSSEENLLVKIRLQWLIDEFLQNKKNSEISKYLFSLKEIGEKEIYELLKCMMHLVDSKSAIDEINTFKDFSNSLNLLIEKFNINNFFTSSAFFYCYFFYSSKKKIQISIIQENLKIFDFQNIDKLEKLFIKLFFKKKGNKLKKIDFLVNYLFSIFN